LSLLACGADQSSTANEPTGQAQARATFAFVPDQVVATRTPFLAGCLGANVPFSDDDLFSLQPVEQASPQTVRSIAITFKRTVTKNAALDLALGGPVRGATFENADQAQSPDEKTGVGLIVSLKDGSPAKPLSAAKVTVTDVPTKDGEPMSAHVTLEFTDGDVLDQTFTGKLSSYEGSCASGG
jgi:hypothetical protein